MFKFWPNFQKNKCQSEIEDIELAKLNSYIDLKQEEQNRVYEVWQKECLKLEELITENAAAHQIKVLERKCQLLEQKFNEITQVILARQEDLHEVIYKNEILTVYLASGGKENVQIDARKLSILEAERFDNQKQRQIEQNVLANQRHKRKQA